MPDRLTRHDFAVLGSDANSQPGHALATMNRRSMRLPAMAAAVLVAMGISIPHALAQPPAPAAGVAHSTSPRIEKLNQSFHEHLAELGPSHAIAVATIREGWNSTYRAGPRESFVPDALCVLYPSFRQIVSAFDEQRSEECLRLIAAQAGPDDPYLAANTAYFQARSMIELHQIEEAERLLDGWLGDASASRDALVDESEKAVAAARKIPLDRLTPYGPHLHFMHAFCQTRNLRYEKAQATLKRLREQFEDAPEAVAVGARQLLVELERREKGTLGEVSEVMDYVSDRLNVVDGSDPVRERQQQVIAMLDKLIQEQEQQEQQSSGQGGQSKKGKKGKAGNKKGNQPSDGAERSTDESASGGNTDLHGAPKVAAGEVWGSLPPAEREKILQSIRERFPSRYRQLVEQYYRSLAEQK